jgi:hypothetical protein
MALQALGSNGSYVKVSGHGRNALDFHIAYHIGKLSAAHRRLASTSSLKIRASTRS